MVEFERNLKQSKKMDGLKRRFYILGLSLLVLIIALAGLLGVLDILPEVTSSAPETANNIQPPATTAPNVTPKPPETPSLPSPTATPSLPNISPKFKLSLPDSFDLDISKAINPGLSLTSFPQVQFPVMTVAGAGNTEYLKSITSSYFNGHEWQTEEPANTLEYKGQTFKPPVTEPTLITTDNIKVNVLADIADGQAVIPTSLYTTSISSSTPVLYSPEEMAFLSQNEFPEEYSFTTSHYEYHFMIMAEAETDPSDKYLQLPDNITQRTRDLAEQITAEIQSPAYKARAIEKYLKENYAYNLDFEPAPKTWEPNDWFLFEEKSGVCTNFNSAFVIMCRTLGIPARLAGGFRINPQDDEQTVYSDRAHAWAEIKLKDLGWTAYDATGSLPLYQKTMTDITLVNPTATKGKEFTVKGTVLTDKYKPTDGGLVEILVNETKDAEGAVLVGQGIMKDGHFEIKAVIPGDVAVGNYQIMAHALENARYEESWSDPVIKVVTGTVINVNVPARIKTGETLTLTGVLTGEFGEALANQTLQIQLDGGVRANPITDGAGNFSWSGTFNAAGIYTLKTIYSGTEYYLASTQETQIRVLAPAVITLEANGNTVNKDVIISGTLKEDTVRTPLVNRALSVYINGALTDLSPVTGNKGEFEFKNVFDKQGSHIVEVRFPGDNDYFEANKSLDIEIVTASGFSPWLLIVIALGLAAGGAGGWFFYQRMKREPQTATAGAGTVTTTEPVLTNRQSTGPGFVLTIMFPQIAEPFPDVWGAGEELMIDIRLTDGNGTGLSALVEINVNNVRTRTVTDEKGKAELRRVFKDKGKYDIAVNFETDTLNKASAVRTMRIVDYREEIVSIFDKLVAGFKATGIPISSEYTPRKIQYLVNTSDKGIPEKALETAVNCFEETDYSLHSITRKHYEAMYIAQTEIEKHGS